MSLTAALGWQPAFQINKGGADITASLSDRITSISVTSVSGNGENDRLDLVIDDRDWAVSVPETDGVDQATLGIYLGYVQSGLYDQGRFHIGEAHILGMPKSLRLHGTSMGFQTNLKAPIITAYDGKTLNDVIQAIGTAGSLAVAVDPELGQKAVAFLNQHSSSMHVLQELERRYAGVPDRLVRTVPLHPVPSSWRPMRALRAATRAGRASPRRRALVGQGCGALALWSGQAAPAHAAAALDHLADPSHLRGAVDVLSRPRWRRGPAHIVL